MSEGVVTAESLPVQAGWTLLKICGASLLVAVLAFVTYTNLTGWRFMVTVNEVRRACSEGTPCVQKVPLNSFGFEMTFPAELNVEVGDVVSAAFTCEWGKCRLTDARVFSGSQKPRAAGALSSPDAEHAR